MNQDISEGKWKEMRGQLTEWWGKITDEDLEKTGGNFEKVVGLLQQKYGFSRRRAESEFNRRIHDFRTKVEKV